VCGLSGIFGTITFKEESVFKDMLAFNIVRGKDSTGAASIERHTGEVDWFKMVGTAWDLMDAKRFDKLMGGFHSMLIGHNRAATRGAVSSRNAHPFDFNNIIGMHNGTISYTSKSGLPDSTKFDTDSETVMNAFDIGDPIRVIEDKLTERSDAYAFVWYDRRTKQLNLIRNSERPLYYVMSEDNKTLFFMSEAEMLWSSVSRNKVKMGKVMLLPENTLMAWTLPKYDSVFEEPARTKVVQNIKETNYYSGNNNNHKGEVWSSGRGWHNKHDDKPVPYDPHTGELLERGSLRPNAVCLLPQDKVGSGTDGATLPPAVVKPTTDKEKVVNLHDRIKSAQGRLQPRIGPGLKEKDGPFRGLTPWLVTGAYRVYYNQDENYWVEATWETSKWMRKTSKLAPIGLSYPKMDINARHEFLHVGKKKRKKIYYRGYGGKTLERDQFEQYMSFGCASCNRRPEWGNYVQFLNIDHDFLCEFCCLDKPLLQQWLDASVNIARA